MENRSRTRQKLRGAAILAALGALVVSATAGAAAVKTPVIKKVTPQSLNVAAKLIITGKYFRRGRGKNRVLFKRTAGKSLFVKADVSTTKRMAVVIPKRLESYMAQPGGKPVATRFRLRVLTSKLSKAFTSNANSPVVGPKRPKVVTPPPAPPEGDCDGDGLKNSVDTDDDNDLLTDTQEIALHLDPCSGDTDGDGVEDGYEYQSALDLNNDDYQEANQVVPYPGKKPYPNPLFKDADVDYDGDGLTQAIGCRLGGYSVTHNGAANALNALSYSDGLQASIYTRDAAPNDRRVPALPA